LRENPDLAYEIENKVRESLGIPLLAESVDAPVAKEAKEPKEPKAGKAAKEPKADAEVLA
jgi:recombination protein RecA